MRNLTKEKKSDKMRWQGLYTSAKNIYRIIYSKIVVPKYYKANFLKIINHNGTLLDVGCGNNSPYKIKSVYPDLIYTGIDIGDYNQIKPNLADKYIIVEPERFAQAIAEMPENFDTVVSHHNLEHVNDRKKTLESMIMSLKPNGYLYLAFPTENSINFPGPRKGTLNYYDDPTHKDTPPDFEQTILTLKQNNMKILFASESYKPFVMYIIGFLLERKSKKDKETKFGTWTYWGFHAIIWAKKNK